MPFAPGHVGGLNVQSLALTASTDIPAGYRAVVFGKLTIPSTVSLTISSTGQLIVNTQLLPGF